MVRLGMSMTSWSFLFALVFIMACCGMMKLMILSNKIHSTFQWFCNGCTNTKSSKIAEVNNQQSKVILTMDGARTRTIQRVYNVIISRIHARIWLEVKPSEIIKKRSLNTTIHGLA